MGKHAPRQGPVLRGKLYTVARQMRRDPTPAEDLLWQHVRDRRLAGMKFYRQVPVDRFVVDFYAPKAGLIIEVDGAIHHKQVAADQERDQILSGLGLRVLRFSNDQVLEQTDQVLERIKEAF